MLLRFILVVLVVAKEVVGANENEVQKLEKEIKELYRTSTLTNRFQSSESDLNPEKCRVYEEDEYYDFIIIGSGAAGSVLANRLTEVKQWKVLVLEAGTFESEVTQIPSFATSILNTPYNWKYTLEPHNTSCLGMIDNRCQLDGGRGVGGGTIINGMVVTRGNAKDYDLIEKMGHKGWSYRNMLPYFKKLETANIIDKDQEYHGTKGPMHVENPGYTELNHSAFLEAHKAYGLNRLDYNGRKQFGVGLVQANTKRGKRVSTGEAYADPTKFRRNIVLRTASHVTKIIVDPVTKQAVAVQYLYNGSWLITSKTRKEILLSAGAINTPHILKLSGIGPKEELAKFNIPVIQDLPDVGQHLKNQMNFNGVTYLYNKQEPYEEPALTDQIRQYLDHKGSFTLAGPEIVAFTKTGAQKDSEDRPDIELLYAAGANNYGYENTGFLRWKEETYNGLYKPTEGKSGFAVYIIQMHPQSTGSVTLKDADPLHRPIVDIHPFSDPQNNDIENMLAGVRLALNITNTEDIQKLGVSLNTNHVPGCEPFGFGTDDYWRCAIRHISSPTRHVTGTAQMGLVVNSELNVLGVHNLRVIDNSVLPVTISGHTMIAAIAIAERAADLIKELWLNHQSY